MGRRGGKSRVLALVAVFLAAFRDYSPYLGAGEIATVVIIAANRMQARSIFRYTLGLLEAAPVLARMIKDASADQISDGPYEVLRARLWAQCRASFAGVACRRFSINSAD